jgi:hypothetical protein
MRRRDALRAGGAALFGGTLATGRAGGHDDPTAGATAESPDGEPEAATGGFEPLARLAVPGAKELVVDGTTAFVAATDGFATVDVADPADPTLLAERRDPLADHPDGPLRAVYDGKVGGDHYAVGGPSNESTQGLRAAAVYDVSAPAAPERVLAYETDFYHHNLDVDDGTLYLCGNDGDRNPLVCVDVDTGEELGRWSVLDEDERWADVDPLLREIHDVRVADGVAHVANWNAGTWLVDVADPASPETIAGLRGLDPGAQATISGAEAVREARFQLPGNDHFAMPRRRERRERPADGDLLALNEEAWGSSPDATVGDLGGVEIWDAASEERLSRIEAPPTEDATYAGVWTTPHNFDFVGEYLYTSWYRGGVKVHDASDPAAPAEVAHWRDSETTEFWTVQRAEGCLVASSWRDPSADAPEAGAAVYTFPTPEDLPAGADGTATEDDGAGLGPVVGAAGLGTVALFRRLREHARGDGDGR